MSPKLWGFLGVVTCMFFLGCENAAENKPEAKELSFKDAVMTLVETENKIREGFASGNIEAAHDPIHEVGHTLNKLATLASKESFSGEQMESLRHAVESLIKSFGEVDKTLHGGKGKSYDELSDTVTSAMKTISQLAGLEVEDQTEEKSFAEVVTTLVEMKNAIRDGFASGDLDGAHEPLHEVGHSLSALVELAEKEEFTTEQVDALKAATESLLDDFGEIDKTFHGGEGKTYDELADSVAEAMKTITDMAGVEDKSVAPSDLETDEFESADSVEIQEVESPDSDDNQ